MFKVDLQNEVDYKTKKVVAKSVIVIMGGALVATPLARSLIMITKVNYQEIVGQIMMKLVVMSCICFCFISKAQTIHEGKDSVQISPEFEFVTLAGQKVSSKNLKGKIILLDFWSSSCNPCRKAMPQLEKFYNEYKNDPRIAIYLVNSGWETIEVAKSFTSGSKYDLPFAYDNGSSVMKSFGLEYNPSTIIIDTKFRIRIRHSEVIENIYDYLTKKVEQYLAEK